ncbi:peptidase M20, partial [Spirillospora sp. NPDC046719]
MTAAGLPAPLGPGDRDLLLRLLRLPTAGPLEPDAPPPRLAEAQVAYRRHAARIGLRTVRHAPAGGAARVGGPGPAGGGAGAAPPAVRGFQPTLRLRRRPG